MSNRNVAHLLGIILCFILYIIFSGLASPIGAEWLVFGAWIAGAIYGQIVGHWINK